MCTNEECSVMLGHASCFTRSSRYAVLAFLASVPPRQECRIHFCAGGALIAQNVQWSQLIHLIICLISLFVISSLQASQELNITMRDPNYQNPYSKSHKKDQDKQQTVEQNSVKKNRRKVHKKGPHMSSGTFTGEL
jgi:hypothetical protein